MSTALITGASSGIGRQFALQLSDEMDKLIITARRKGKLLDLTDELSPNVEVDIVVADLSEEKGITEIEKLIKSTPDLTYLVNNAGFGLIGKFDEIDYEKHEDMMKVHMIAPVRHTHAALPIMKKNNNGAIINVSSLEAFSKKTGSTLYAPTKSFLVKFTRGLSRQYSKKYDLSFQALCPGFTYSEFHQTDEFEGRNPYSVYPSIIWMESEVVVKKSLDAINKGKVVYIPGFINKIIRILLSLKLVGS